MAAKRAIDAGRLNRCRHVGTHTLRHSYARHLLLNGIPLNYLSRWLGHATIQTTLVYLECRTLPAAWRQCPSRRGTVRTSPQAKDGRVWGKLCQPSDECSRACGQTATLLISINEADHPKLTERHLMELRNEIKDVILLAAQRVLSNTAGDLSAADEARLRANLEGRIPLYTERYPILGLLNELDAVADAGHAAAVATNAAIKQQHGIPNLGWDDELGKFRTPITDQWTNAIRESAAEAAEEYFRKASTYFEQNQREQATECLCSAIICSIAATAALLGWPHRDRDDDLRTVVALATGSLPAEGESVYKLLQSASQQGQDLNSAFAAAMGQPDAVRTGAYQEAGRTNDEAFLFARTAVTLADQLGRRLR